MNRIVDIHADDFALSENSDKDILQLCREEKLDSISIIPNLECFETAVANFLSIQEKSDKKILVSVHLNFMEGKCCAEKSLLPDLVDSEGFFTAYWGKLFIWNYIPSFREKIKLQLKTEILAQVRKCLDANIINKNAIRIDSHQHPHMIPLVFEALKEAVFELENDGYKIEYIRNTQDPILLYGGKDIFSMNTVKCLILNFYSIKVKNYLISKKLPVNYLCGVYFSGKMDSRLKKVLPKFIKKAEKQDRNIELLFHPGTMLKSELTREFKKEVFNEFHLSENIKIEYNTLKEL
ncbi:MAG: ChbG/HpnK family deacetylase [Treponema berlinense]|uniref:ChbG/HpnK family deacetylase n=1 Tax=Treponema berlinense TaxID=225004 RepID=UPI002A811B1F|nr:ChbG/HpnK family deacetylase [Treponema berlinense]MDY3708278.1 ChbG/HpnK family deacetylase [Treponema berlinense]